jgi:hypothetical protein
MRWAVASLALLILAVPGLPPAAAQTAESSPYVAVFSDTFDADLGWEHPISDTSDGWFRIADGKVNDLPRMVWYASRLDANGGPGGYSNNVNAQLTSPAIVLPQGMSLYGIVLSLKGSSENGPDFLRLEWAPDTPEYAENWEELKRWTGGALASAYQQEVYSSAKFLAHTGPMTLRLVFVSNPTCDSNPGTPGASIDSDSAPGYTGPTDPTGPAPAPSDVDPGTPGSVVNPGETGQRCGATGAGWFIDSLQVMARRNFAALASPTAPRIALDAAGTGTVATNLISDMGKVLDFRIDDASATGGPFTSMAVLLMRSGSSDQLTVHL